MFCHNCGVPQSADASFCAECGARQNPPESEGAESAEPAAAPVASEEYGSQQAADKSTPIAEPATRQRWHGSRLAILVCWAVTVVWISLVTLHAYANWPRLSRLEGNVGDFLIRAIAPVILFWLVMGYLQLAARLRHSDALNLQAARVVNDTEKAAAVVSELVSQAQGALQRLEAEIQMLRDHDKGRMRAMQPRWEVNGHIAHEKVHEINLRNAGAAATSLGALWDKSVPMAVILSDTTLVDRGGTLTIKAMFLEGRKDQFELKLQYHDGANESRTAQIVVSDMEIAIRQDEF